VFEVATIGIQTLSKPPKCCKSVYIFLDHSVCNNNLFFYAKNGNANAPQYYIILSSPVLYIISSVRPFRQLTSQPVGVCVSSLSFCLTSAMCFSTRQRSFRIMGQHFSIPRYAPAQGKQHYLKLKVASFINSTINNRVEFTFYAAARGGICCRRVHMSGAGESERLRNDKKILANGVSQ